MMKLSIVLTVYNKEQYLRRAFDALLAQEGTSDGDYEILVVNDGSTDGSSAIIEEIARENKRIRVLSQKNQGLSMARNNGVDALQGEYVWFVDADDIISSLSVKLICEAIASQPDVIPIYAKTEGVDIVRNAIPVDVKTGKDILVCGRWQQCGVFYIYRKSFLLDNNLRFMPGVYHEVAGITPSHCDSHEHTHAIGSLEEVHCRVLDLHHITRVRRRAIPSIRLMLKSRKQTDIVHLDKSKAMMAKKRNVLYRRLHLFVVKYNSWKWNRRMSKRYTLTDAFYSFRDFYSFRNILDLGGKSSVVELMCHPGNKPYLKETDNLMNAKSWMSDDYQLINYNQF